MMNPLHIEFLVEEDSMESFLRGALPKLLGKSVTWAIHPFNGKRALLKKMPDRFRGYARMPENYRIVVLVDRDDEDCYKLKAKLEKHARQARLTAPTDAGGKPARVFNRIVIEELEAWYFGDMDAVRAAYPRVRPGIENKAKFRKPDEINGGTWEKFERVLKDAGYYKGGLSKIEAARNIAAHLDPARNCSPSFQLFAKTLSSLGECGC